MVWELFVQQGQRHWNTVSGVGSQIRRSASKVIGEEFRGVWKN
jgi:hypothetical protein